MDEEHRDNDMAGTEAHEEAHICGEPIDTKYEFLAWKFGRHGEDDPITESEGIVFRARDNALVPTLQFYRDECARIGASAAQIAGINALITRVEKYRERNPHLCKVPD